MWSWLVGTPSAHPPRGDTVAQVGPAPEAVGPSLAPKGVGPSHHLCVADSQRNPYSITNTFILAEMKRPENKNAFKAALLPTRLLRVFGSPLERRHMPTFRHVRPYRLEQRCKNHTASRSGGRRPRRPNCMLPLERQPDNHTASCSGEPNTAKNAPALPADLPDLRQKLQSGHLTTRVETLYPRILPT